MIPATNITTGPPMDNGLTPSDWGEEQYTIVMQQYGGTTDYNAATGNVGIVDQFLKNAKANAIQAEQTIDEIARRTLFAAYMGGATRVSVTNGSVVATVSVDDARGFYQAPQLTAVSLSSVPVAFSGALAAVSAANPLPATINGAVVSIIGCVADGVVTNGVVSGTGNGDGNVVPPGLTFSGTGNNTSTAPGGFSGVLTLSATITVANATAGNTVLAGNASQIIRPNGRANTGLLQATDTLTMSNILDAVALLRMNNVPGVGLEDSTAAAAGHEPYNVYIDPKSARQLFADPDFKQLFQGATSAAQVIKRANEKKFLGVRFMPTTEAYTQSLPGGGTVHRVAVVGGGALVEADFAGQPEHDVNKDGAVISEYDNFVLVTRPPLDRLQQIIAQSWYWMGGFAAPSDMTAIQTIIPTVTASTFKRGVIIEHVA